MRIFWILLVMVTALPSIAQDLIKFEGQVSDTIQSPVELANVVAYDQETNAITSFGVTDHQGIFVLKLEEDKNYLLKVTFVGYENFEASILARENSDNRLTIELVPSLEQLRAMEVVEEFPVVISGDTIVYKADAFTNGTERKLEDVFEALPGFEVDEYGGVRVQGKQVEKILVEGKEFFEGDTKLAVQNIPANAVDKVQVLRNFTDIVPMGSLGDDDDRLAINIKLDDDKKNLFFGDVEVGVGLDRRYFAHANLFAYGPKTTLNFIGDGNNIGRQAFTARDYFRFMGGMRGLSNGSGSSFNITTNDLGFMELQNNSALNIDSKLGAFNFNHVPNKVWKFSGFAIGSNADNTIRSINQRTYVRESEDNQETVSTEEDRSNLSGLAKLNISYTPNENLHVGFDLFAKATDLNSDLQRNSDLLGQENTISNLSEQQPLLISQQLEAYYAWNERNIMSLEANYSYQSQNPYFQIASSDILFGGWLPLIGSDIFEFSQNKETSTHQQETLGNWYHIINNKNHINFSFGNTLSKQTMTSGMFQDQNPELQNQLYNNDAGFTFLDLYAGLNFKTKWGKFTFNPGVNLHQYTVKDIQFSNKNEYQKWLLLPEMSTEFKINSSQNILLQYSLQARFSDVEMLASGLVIQNYNSLYQGNRNLQNSVYHNFDLRYNNFSLFSHLNIYGGLNYQKRYEDITQSVVYSNLQRLFSPINTLDANEMFTANASATKTFTNFKIQSKVNFYYASTGNTIDGQTNRNETMAHQIDISAESTFFKILTVKGGYEKIFNRYESSSASNKYQNHKPYSKVELNFFKSFTLAFDYEYNNYRSKDGETSSEYDFLNAALYFQKDKSPWQVKIRGMNLLDTRSIRRDSFMESQINTFTYLVQPRYFLVSLKYEI